MKCSYCGYDNPEGAHFCSGCGKKLDAQAPQGQSGEPLQDTQVYRRQERPGQWEEPPRQPYQPYRQPEPERPRRESSGSGSGRAADKAAGRRNKEEKKIILIGVVLACVVVAAGIAAYLLLSRYMGGGEDGEREALAVTSSSETSSGSEKEETSSENQRPEPTEDPEETPRKTPTPTPKPTEVPLTVSLVDAEQADMTGYSRVGVREAMASSVVEQEGYDNTAAMAVDGDVITSWQEGADGDGINEFINLKLDREYEVRYITLNLGNWRDQDRYDKNNVPKTLTIWLDEKSFLFASDRGDAPDQESAVYYRLSVDGGEAESFLTLPHKAEKLVPMGEDQFCLEFSRDCPASEIYVRIDDVYEGSLWDDTCISEIGIYGA